jgi:hypothetical protein
MFSRKHIHQLMNQVPTLIEEEEADGPTPQQIIRNNIDIQIIVLKLSYKPQKFYFILFYLFLFFYFFIFFAVL